MRRKYLALATATFMAVMLMSSTAIAAEWQQDNVGWRYQEDDGSYTMNTWKWIGDKCYFFAADGYMLSNTVTLDGYTVDESGAWVQDIPKVERDWYIGEDGLAHGPEGDKEGYTYIPGYGYVDMSNAGRAQEGNNGGPSEDELSGNKIGNMG